MKVCSLNIRGLGNKQKRDQVFHWLRQQLSSVYFLQETHLNKDSEQNWLSEWGQKAFFSGSKTNSEGICILFDEYFTFDLIKYIDLVPGRLQIVEIEHEEKELTLINIYGYNSDDTFLFDKLYTYLGENKDKTFIIEDDFNTVLNNELDKKMEYSKLIKNVGLF